MEEEKEASLDSDQMRHRKILRSHPSHCFAMISEAYTGKYPPTAPGHSAEKIRIATDIFASVSKAHDSFGRKRASIDIKKQNDATSREMEEIFYSYLPDAL